MPQISGRIMYVNDAKAGQRSGSLKLDTGDYIGVPTNMLYQFQRGQEVTLEYNDRQASSGKWFKDLVVTQQAPPPSYQQPRPPQGNGSYAPAPQVSRPAAPRPSAAPRPPAPQQGRSPGPHDYNTGKQICITGISQRAIQSGKFEASDIPVIMRIVAETYDDIFNPLPKPQPIPPQQQATGAYDRGQPAGPRDEIPFDDSVADLGYDEDPNRPPF